MKVLTKLLFLLTLASLGGAWVSAQNVPLAISYQAALTDDGGAPLSPDAPTNYPIEFRIYDAVEDGNLLWSESQNVSVYQGSFSTLLGTGDEITGESRPQLDTVFDSSERYLDITIDDSGTPKTFTPRQKMVSTPFAFRSAIADKALSVDGAGVVISENLASGSVDGTKLASNAVTAAKIESLAVTSAKIAENAVDSTKLANDAVLLDKLAAEVANRLVPAGTVVAWAGPNTGSEVAQSRSPVPAGWVLCDGRTVSVFDYPELYSAIGLTYGSSGWFGFKVPDYRGYFLRGDAMGTSVDPNWSTRSSSPGFSTSKVGSKQEGAVGPHEHDWLFKETDDAAGDSANSFDSKGTGGASQGTQANPTKIRAAGTAQETRPKNISVYYIIKAH